jgi:putative heme transporter
MPNEDNPSTSSDGKKPTNGARPGGLTWWKIIAAGVAILFLGVALLFLFRILVRPMALLVIAIAISAALTPIIHFLERWLPRLAAIILTYLLIVSVFVGLGWLVLPALIGQLRSLAAEIPDLIEAIQRLLDQWDIEMTTSLLDTITAQLGGVGSALLMLPLAITSSLLDLILVMFISLYLLIDLPKMTRFVKSLLPEEDETEVLSVAAEMGSAMGGYVRGVVIDGAIVGLITYIGLMIIGVEFSLALGILSGILEIIPVLGPIIAASAAILVALGDSPTQALTVLIFMVILQQIESHILVPNIMRSQAEVSPLLVVLAVFAGATVGGLLGALVAIPLAAAGVVFVKRVVAPALRRRTGAGPSRSSSN